MKIALKILKIIGIVVISLFLLYAVLFSIVGTYAIYKGYRSFDQYVVQPFNEVKKLATENPLQSSYMALYRAELKRTGQSDSLIQIFIPLDSISPYLPEAVIAAEDDGFYIHPGFDLEAMLSAYDYNMRYKKIKRGGSTITQQLAKNLFLSNVRSFERKFKELAYTLLMEKYYGKKRILELYLNYAQWGPHLFGCEAASLYYFKKSCNKLTRVESIRLAAVLVSPGRLSPLNGQSGFMASRIQVIAGNLYKHHKIDDSGYRNITGSPPPLDSSRLDTQNVDADTLISNPDPNALNPADSSSQKP